MIRLRLRLRPKKNMPISLNYKYYLAAICNNLVNSGDDNYDEKLKEYNMKSENRKVELLTFSQFFCMNHETWDSKIKFNDTVYWYITSPLYELILHMVQELYTEGSLKIAKEEFEILGFEVIETEDTTVISLNKEYFTLHINNGENLMDKLESYYLLLKDELII